MALSGCLFMNWRCIVLFEIGTLVKRSPEMEEYMYPHELEEVGIVISYEQDDTFYDVVYVIVLWGDDLSWDSPGDLLEVT